MMKPMKKTDFKHFKDNDTDPSNTRTENADSIANTGRRLPHMSKKQTAAIAVMLAAGLVVSVSARHYEGIPEETTVAETVPAITTTATLSELPPAQGLHFGGLRSSLVNLLDSESESQFKAAPDKLNLAYFYRDGADKSDTIHSYAGEVYQKLMTADNEYLAKIYDEAGVSPLNLAKRLGVSSSRVMGKYNPNAGGQDPNNSASWYIPNFKNVNVSFYNADGKQVNEYSNVKDIMSMASVYCYAHDYLDADLFETYCEELYEKSRRYTISIGNVYYDNGCINRSAKEEGDDAKKLEEALAALKLRLQQATNGVTQAALNSGSYTISPQNQVVLNLTGETSSSTVEMKNYETQTDADGNAGGKGIIFHTSGNDNTQSSTNDSANADGQVVPETAAASTEAQSSVTTAPTQTAETTQAQTAAQTQSASGNGVLVLGAMQRVQKLSSLTQSERKVSTMERAAEETLASLDGVYYGKPGNYGSAKEYAESVNSTANVHAKASLTSEMLVFGAADAAGSGVTSVPETAAASTEVSQTNVAQTDASVAETADAGQSGNAIEETNADGSKKKRYAGYEAGKGINEVNRPTNASSTETSAASSESKASVDGQIVLGTFTGEQLKNMDDNTLRQLVQESLAAEEDKSSNNVTDIHSKNYCPGHVDLYVKVTIYGFDDEKGLRTIDLKADDQDENEATKSLDVALARNGWNGWTEEQIGYVKTLIEQDWFTTYGLSISTINPKQPLTGEEISKYLSSLPENISDERKAVIKFALSSVGKVPYYYGGKASGKNYEANGFGRVVEADYKGRVLRGLDCSGWVQWVYWSAIGNKLNGAGSTAALIGEGTKIKRSELQPGDIIVRVGSDSHVVMFLQWAGNGNMIVIHENSGANNVSVNEVTANYPYYRKLIN